MITITYVTLTHATVTVGKLHQNYDWDHLISLASSAPRLDGDGSPGEYKILLAGAIPLVKRAGEEAYADYCGQGVTTRTGCSVHATGHGSWSSGPDSRLQSTYHAWAKLLWRLRSAIK